MLKLLDFLTLFLYCAFIFWLSDQTVVPTPVFFPHQDKVIHASAYFIMALLALRCFTHFISNPIILTFTVILFCSFYGISDEWHQSFVKDRQADVFDWLADTTGAFLAVFFYIQLKRHRLKFGIF